MGKRGPRPTPTKLREVRGNPGKRPLNRSEPTPPTGRPRCPDWLIPEAKRVWQRLVPMLDRMGVLTKIDADVVAAYCQSYARWREAEEFITKRGAVYPWKDKSGRVMFIQFPQVAMSRHHLHLMRGLQQELGLTPSSRTQIVGSARPSLRPHDPHEAENDELEERLLGHLRPVG